MLSNNVSFKTRNNGLWAKIATAFLAAMFISGYGNRKSYYELFVTPAYYIAVGASFMIAFAVLITIYYASGFLDKRFPWNRDTFVRGLLQLVGGVLLALGLAFLMAAGYFYLLNIQISVTGYFRFLFDWVILYVVAINIYYCRDFIVKLFKKGDEHHFVGPPFRKNHDEQYILPVTGGVDDPALIYTEGKFLLAKNKYNELITWEYPTIKSSDAVLPKDKYFRLNRYVIVRRDIIDKVTKMEAGLMLTLIPPFTETYAVSKNRTPAFKTFGAATKMPWASI